MTAKLVNGLERWLPVLAAIVAFVGWESLAINGWAARIEGQFGLKDLMSASFNLVAFATPLTIGLFAIALSPGGGFIQKIFGTKTFRLFVHYVIVAFVIGIAALLATIPYLAVKDNTIALTWLAKATGLWWGLMASAIAAIGRVVVVFLVWARSYSTPIN